MPRRRSRYVVVAAVVLGFLLWRVLMNTWDERDSRSGFISAQPPIPPPAPVTPPDAPPPPPPEYPPLEKPDESVEKDSPPSRPESVEDTPKVAVQDDVEIPPLESTATPVPLPKPLDEDAGGSTAGASKATSKDGAPAEDKDKQDSLAWKDSPKGGIVDPIKKPAGVPAVHWTPVEEHYPIDSLIALPTGTPKKIPKIQFDFGPESEQAMTTRLERQKKVKAELERSWAGYVKYAWMHDELHPLSGKYRDPFCGWAATLVDSLDTLWIAGMKEEFDTAAKAVKDIDFTTTFRLDIPVFETTIRYLGGLLAAFDVSGGHSGSYPVLLAKAKELGDILLGIFDTPNRMPILYYNWQPDSASQPHRASKVGIAELGTLSMEFTRLAQLTGLDKYYDGIDRITDALVEMQAAGTAIPGLFPENLDASGCSKTATVDPETLSKDAQSQLGSEEAKKDPQGFSPISDGKIASGGKEVAYGGKQPPTNADDRIQRRDEGAAKVNYEQQSKPPFTASGATMGWDCVPQGLVPFRTTSQSFSIGGSQDSTYEYFPKQYLLLGGLESKYQKLYEDTVDAINEWLLFRPMSDDDWDVLFPAKIITNGDPENDLSPHYEITHLTCFVGGMYGLGGKIFGRDDDIEKAKKLTDGCVWAYQSTPSGLMPEYASVIQCPTLDKCEFNETEWHEMLDPMWSVRDKEIEKWEAHQLLLAVEETSAANLAKADADAEDASTLGSPKDTVSSSYASTSGSPLASSEDSTLDSGYDSTSEKATPFDKRAVIPPQEDLAEESEPGSQLPASLKDQLGYPSDDRVADSTSEKTVASTEKKPESKPPMVPPIVPPHSRQQVPFEKPQTHEEFVQARLRNERLPPGFTSVNGRSYILRPEAIESVWYMYRITGDPTWMDKGWTMFEATIRATRTENGNSAIYDVMQDSSGLMDQMESFWIAETLKYYYLLFSEPDLISLDEWVLNTEAHPFPRPR